HFRDVTKMVRHQVAASRAGVPRALQDCQEVLPALVPEQALQIAREPALDALGSAHEALEGSQETGDQVSVHDVVTSTTSTDGARDGCTCRRGFSPGPRPDLPPRPAPVPGRSSRLLRAPAQES